MGKSGYYKALTGLCVASVCVCACVCVLCILPDPEIQGHYTQAGTQTARAIHHGNSLIAISTILSLAAVEVNMESNWGAEEARRERWRLQMCNPTLQHISALTHTRTHTPKYICTDLHTREIQVESFENPW